MLNLTSKLNWKFLSFDELNEVINSSKYWLKDHFLEEEEESQGSRWISVCLTRLKRTEGEAPSPTIQFLSSASWHCQKHQTHVSVQPTLIIIKCFSITCCWSYFDKIKAGFSACFGSRLSVLSSGVRWSNEADRRGSDLVNRSRVAVIRSSLSAGKVFRRELHFVSWAGL